MIGGGALAAKIADLGFSQGSFLSAKDEKIAEVRFQNR